MNPCVNMRCSAEIPDHIRAFDSPVIPDSVIADVAFAIKGKMKIVPVYENEEFIPYLLIPLLNVKYTKDDFDGFIQKLYEEILR